MTSLVTGGAGFIGSHLAEALVREEIRSFFWMTLRRGLSTTFAIFGPIRPFTVSLIR